MATHTASEDDKAFRAAFEACGVSPAAFNHEAHLRLAYVYLVEHGVEGAHQRMRQALLAFLAHHQIPAAKFHETLTRAWVLAVSHFMSKSASSSFSEFAAKSQPLFDSRAMLTHYSAETLFSPEARASYLEPDLEAIPQEQRPHATRAVSNLRTLLAGMQPALNPGRYAFVTLPPGYACSATLVATVREPEGVSAILAERDAIDLGVPIAFTAAWITLTVHSDLAAVGLTAAFSAALANAGISCNVVAGVHHDHLFVPVERAHEAMDALHALSASCPPQTRSSREP